MTRLFLRLWLGLIVALVLAVGATVLIVSSEDSRGRTHLERILSAPIKTMRDLVRGGIANGATPEEAFAKVTRAMEVPTDLVTIDELDLMPPQRRRLAEGQNVAQLVGDEVTQLIAIDERYVMSLGPTRAQRPDRTRPLVAVACLVAALFVGLWLLVRPIERRLRRLGDAADALGTGKLAARADARGKDGIAKLGAHFNGMAARIEHLVTRQQELLRVVSHELRTPLQRVRFALDMRLHDDMERDLDELDRLIDELLTYVRLDAEPVIDSAPSALGPAMAELVSELSQGAAIVPAWDGTPMELSAHIDPRLFKRAVGNLVSNAQRYAKAAVQIHARVDDVVRIDVDDDGPGVAEAERARIFEPFFRAAGAPEVRTNGAGAGLGLAIVKRIAETHAGRVEVGGSPLGGARFSFVLPASTR